jgi:hypothetical protein
MAAILGECNSESNRTPCNVSVVSILLVQQRGNFRIVRQFFCNRIGEEIRKDRTLYPDVKLLSLSR